jgi:hypothetical protein
MTTTTTWSQKRHFHPFFSNHFFPGQKMTIIFFLGQNPKTPINNNPCQTNAFPTVVAGLKKMSLSIVSPFEFN